MVRAPIATPMAINMLVRSKMASGTVKVFCRFRPMTAPMLGTGAITNKAAKALTPLRMATSMSALLRIMSATAKAPIAMPMAINTLGNSRATNRTVGALTAMRTAKNMLVSSRMTRKVVRAFIPLPVATHTRGRSKTICLMGKAPILMLMAAHILAASNRA